MKSNALLSVFALGLALLAYTERSTVPPPSSDEEQKISSEFLFKVSPEEVSAIAVVGRQGCVVLREEALTSPRAKELLGVLLQVRVIRRFVLESPDLSPYGLTVPSRRVTIEKTGGESSLVIDLGSLNPIGNAVYVRTRNESDVLLVGSYFLASLDMALQGLRAEGNKFFEHDCP